MTLCPRCQDELLTPLVCLGCGALLEVDAGGALSPFELLGLPAGWEVDRKQLKRQLLKFSRAVHPDFFATAEEATRQRAEDASAALNAAHDILGDDFKRANYLVASLGGPSESDERQMPQAFLMQVLEWNEVLEDAQAAKQGSAEWTVMEQLAGELATERQARLAAIAAQLTPLPSAGDANLLATRQELNAVRYIDRTQAEIKNLQLQASLGSRS